MDNHFSNNWIKEKKRNSTDIIRDSLKSQQPLKPKMELAKNKIETQNRKLDSMMEKLKAREKAYFEQVISSLQKHDSQQGKMISNELAQVRKTTRTMSQIKLALEQVHMRLEYTFDINNYGEDVGKILDEASFLAEQRTGMDIPDVPPRGGGRGERDIQKSR